MQLVRVTPPFASWKAVAVVELQTTSYKGSELPVTEPWNRNDTLGTFHTLTPVPPLPVTL